jgi:putative ABC transport system permease protein
MMNGRIMWNTLKKYNCFSTQYEEESNLIKQRIEDIAEGQNYDQNANVNVYDREANVSYAMYKDNAEGLGKLSFSFAFVYIVVAFMVCYSSLGRMITKQKLLIGTQKALGFRASEILAQYLSYAWVCTFWGCAGGILWAVFFVERISLTSYKPIYYFEEYVTAYDLKLTAVVVICAFVLTGAATVITCRKQIRKSTVLLLKDEVVGDGKEFFFEKWRLWKQVSLFKKTIVKNLLNEKRHMVTSIIGIAGCTALMIIGFTMKFAISDVKVEQFENIQKFDVSLQVKASENGKAFTDKLDQFKKLEYISLMDQMIGVRLNSKDNIAADLLCVDADELNGYFLLEDKKTKEIVKDYKEGVLISANTAHYYHIKVNDTIDLMKQNGEKASVSVSGIVKNYVCNFLVMSPEYYRKVMGEDAVNNIYFIKLNGTKQSDLEKAVRTQKGFLDLAGKEMGISIFNNIADSLNSVIQVMIILSAIMALIVVLNLLVMYINEKSKTLAVMRINGYTVREAKSFVNFSNVILNMIGLGVGVLVGIILGYQIVMIIENDCVAYNHEPNVTACLLSCGISIVYALIIGTIDNRKINNLPLTNLNRFE